MGQPHGGVGHRHRGAHRAGAYCPETHRIGPHRRRWERGMIMAAAVLKQDDAAATPAHEWWRGGTIYQIYPRSFADSNNDGIGDLAGITARLSSIRSLGVDAIWISPFFKSPMKDFGYDVSDYK